jgi:hypothetical protein
LFDNVFLALLGVIHGEYATDKGMFSEYAAKHFHAQRSLPHSGILVQEGCKQQERITTL